MPHNESIRSRAEKLAGRPCAIPGCHRPTKMVSPYCGTHAKAAERHGSPLGRSVRNREIGVYLERAKAFLRTNATHPAIQAAVSELNVWLSEAARLAPSIPERKHDRNVDHRVIAELARLHQWKSENGFEMLAEALAVQLLSNADQGRIEPNSKALKFAIANRILSIAPHYTRQVMNHKTGKVETKSARLAPDVQHKLGSEFLDRFGPLLVKACVTLTEKDRKDRERREAFAEAIREPFAQTIAAKVV